MMTVAALADLPATFTPPGLGFDEPTHRYAFAGRDCVSVTTALASAGLVDRLWFTTADAERGQRVHAAIRLLHRGALRDQHLDAEITPFVIAYQKFLSDSALIVDASEERVCDPVLMCAGTLDVRGRFLDARTGRPEPFIDVVDVKTGQVPPWAGYQTAGYVRLLPPHVWRHCRRWALRLTDDGRYQLTQRRGRNDERVFLAAVTIAQARLGWLP